MEDHQMPERNIFLRIFVSLLWFIPFFIICNMIIGGFVCGYYGVKYPPEATATLKEAYQHGYQNGQYYTSQFFKNYGGIISLINLAIWLFLSIRGIFPGTAKFKKIKEKTVN